MSKTITTSGVHMTVNTAAIIHLGHSWHVTQDGRKDQVVVKVSSLPDRVVTIATLTVPEAWGNRWHWWMETVADNVTIYAEPNDN